MKQLTFALLVCLLCLGFITETRAESPNKTLTIAYSGATNGKVNPLRV